MEPGQSNQNEQSQREAEFQTSAPMQGGDLFFQAAQRYGYRVVFGNPGTTEAGFMDALLRYPDLEFVLCLFENVCTGAADGFARMAHWPALVNLHLGPGLANGLSNIHNARLAHSPLVVTIGQHDIHHYLQESPLASDIESLARVECKWVYTVQDAAEMAAALHRATTIAMTPPRGPVALILPSNVMAAPALTGNGEIPSIPDYHPVLSGPASHVALEQAWEQLTQAQRPLFIVGNIEPVAFRLVQRLAQCCGAQIVNDTFPRRSDRPLFEQGIYPYFPALRREFLRQFDTLFLIETGGLANLFYYEFDPAPVIPPQLRVIQLEDEPSSLGLNVPGALPLCGDIASSLELLVELAGPRSEQHELPAPATVPEQPQNSNGAQREPGAVSPVVLMRTLASLLPQDTILADESVTVRDAVVSELLRKETPVTTYLASKGASLGVALPLAIGAQLAEPERPVVAITGDGSAMYTLQGLWTAARMHLPILTIVLNNASYDVIKLELLHWMRGHQEQPDPQRLAAVGGLAEPRLDFAAMARGMGVQSWAIQHESEILPHLQAALALCRQGEPALVDVQLASLFG